MFHPLGWPEMCQGQNVTGIDFSQKTHRLLLWFDLEKCSKVVKNGAIKQNTYDFLLVFCSNFGHISYRFCATVDFMPK